MHFSGAELINALGTALEKAPPTALPWPAAGHRLGNKPYTREQTGPGHLFMGKPPEQTGPVPVKRPVDPSATATGESPTTNMSKVLQWPGPKHVNNVTAKTSMMSRAGSISRKSYETKETNKEDEVKAALCLKVIQTWQHTSMNEQNLPPDWPRENRVLVPMQMAELMGDMAEIGSRASQAGPGIHVKMTNPDKGINQAAGFSLTLIDLLD
ncbi:hypothetical protein C8R43DRAFT_944175 [Mycena crocata]|nr:hypothetical protein C8R43DRAFT_944170 [Mycena crocata]KAJ7171555.1 hypothetical protein C8R43DRAFT_944175 [Mycena crocata]